MRDLESLKWIGNISLPIVKINQSINVLISQLSNQRISSEVSIKRLVSSVARKQADVCHNQNCWLNVCTLKIAITTIYTKINLSYLKHWFILLLKHHFFWVVYDPSPFFFHFMHVYDCSRRDRIAFSLLALKKNTGNIFKCKTS